VLGVGVPQGLRGGLQRRGRKHGEDLVEDVLFETAAADAWHAGAPYSCLPRAHT
jgi:hypothetical protein